MQHDVEGILKIKANLLIQIISSTLTTQCKDGRVDDAHSAALHLWIGISAKFLAQQEWVPIEVELLHLQNEIIRLELGTIR